MARIAKKIHFPKTRLSELAARSGGVTRERAVEEALKSIDNLRDHAVTTINDATATIETILGTAKNGRVSPDDMRKILRQADSIITMAGTFGMAALENIAKSLCDIADGLLNRETQDAAPILVHVQAIRLAAPNKPEIDAAAASHILGELAKVRTHYGFESLAVTVPAEIGPPALAE
jgi:chemotaxis protein histidine kinase CheA